MADKDPWLRRRLRDWWSRLRGQREPQPNEPEDAYLSAPRNPNWTHPPWGVEGLATGACLREHLNGVRHAGVVFEVVAFDRAPDSVLHVLFADATSGEPADGAQVEIA